MNPKTKKYTEVIIKRLVNSFYNDDDYHWLINNNYKELSALRDVLNDNSDGAYEFLLRNKKEFDTMLNFIDALNGKENAVEQLIKDGDIDWAATVNAVLGDKKAHDWLWKNDLTQFAELANLLTGNNGGGSSTNFGGGVSGGGSSGGGFGGFGGGNFGGGGGGGSW